MTEADGKPRHAHAEAPDTGDAAEQNGAEESRNGSGNDRAHLRLVTPETHPQPEPPATHGTLVAILAVLSAVMGAVGYYAVHRPTPVPETVRELIALRDTYAERGLDGYLEEKEALRGRTKSRLEAADEKVRLPARNVAAYLFPDLLDDGDFERELAMDTWVPLETAMEQAPYDDPSRRRAFEDFRNMLWVFERGNRTRAELSRTTRAVIELYDTVTRTR